MSDEYLEPAFPCPDDWKRDSGMSLRDYFAAQAITGLLTKGFVPDIGAQFGAKNHDLYAKQAYIVADAMLAAREAA